MSAFLCTRPYIASLARYIAETSRWERVKQEDLDAQAATVANELLRQNVRSVNYRYSENKRTGRKYTLAEIEAAPLFSNDAALKAAHCVSYQSCETDDYPHTLAAALVSLAEKLAIARGASRDNAAYSAAAWGG